MTAWKYERIVWHSLGDGIRLAAIPANDLLTLSLFEELKRRNVFKVGIAYAVLGWLLLQITDIVVPILDLPGWVDRLVLFLLAIGFPISLILAWAFELTPKGIKLESSTEADQPAAADQRKTLDFVIFGALIIALTYFVWQHDWQDSPNSVSPGDISSIAVLPFDSLTDDPEQAFFVAGIHDALITELSRIDALRVISRTSAMRFQDSNMSVPDISRELGVDAVVEGSVLKVGDVVRVTVQLIEASSDRHLWADNFDRQLSDILALYSDVTSEIANQIQVTLTTDEKAAIGESRPVDPEVYELYLKGHYLCENWSPAEMSRGIELLQEAVSLEPRNASAHAQLSLCLQYSAFFGFAPPDEVYSRSKAAAAMAVQLDDRLAEAHVASAGVLYYLEFKPKAAIATLDRALGLNPASVKALLHSSWLLGEAGRFKDAFERNRHAVSLDPLSTVVNHAIGQLYYLSRDYEQAIVEFSNTLELDRSDPTLHYTLGWAYEQLGQFEEAIARHEEAIELSGGTFRYRASLGHTYGLAGMREQATNILEELQQSPDVSPYDIAIVHLGLGDHERAIDWLEKAFDARDSQLIYVRQGPRFDPLRKNARFMTLLERMDWPPADEPLIAGK